MIYSGTVNAAAVCSESRVAYLQQLRQLDRDERELDRLWLRLWRAERRRDELHRLVQ